jgi:hypothetical protein
MGAAKAVGRNPAIDATATWVADLVRVATNDANATVSIQVPMFDTRAPAQISRKFRDRNGRKVGLFANTTDQPSGRAAAADLFQPVHVTENGLT